MLEMYVMMTVLLGGLFAFFFLMVLIMVALDGKPTQKQREDARYMGLIAICAPLWPLAFVFMGYLVVRGAVNLLRSENA